MAYDVIVIGAGQNGLACAAKLGAMGRKVLVVERRDVVGGLCAGESFHPGYSHTGIHHDSTGLRLEMVENLKLGTHGLNISPDYPEVFAPQEKGTGLLLAHNPKVAAAEIAHHSELDASRYADFRATIAKFRNIIEPLLNEPPPNIFDPGAKDLLGLLPHAIATRRLGKQDMLELMRVPPMCVADWLREYFETELLSSAMAQPAISGAWCGPWSPGTAATLLWHECTKTRGVAGGPTALISALESAAKSAGVDIRTGATVQEIKLSGGAVSGVVLADGEEILATTVASSCDPKVTFLDCLPPHAITHTLEKHIVNYRMRGTSAKVHLALSGPLTFACRPDLRPEFIRTGEHLDDLERAFDPVKYRQLPARPMLEIFVPTIASPDLAPSGHSVASIMVHFVTHGLDGGWTDERREELGDIVIDELARYAPSVRDIQVAREVLTPVDIEQRYGVHGGHIHHGEHGLDQLLTRPAPECASYETPIAGLYLCGGGSHPGGGVSGAAGYLAAKRISGS
jgi:phytoene dehydrogenase-like protein